MYHTLSPRSLSPSLLLLFDLCTFFVCFCVDQMISEQPTSLYIPVLYNPVSYLPLVSALTV